MADRNKLIRLPTAVWRDTAGSTATTFAVMLTAFIGFIGVGVEIGNWYLSRQALQSAADAGALGGAMEFAEFGADGVSEIAIEDATRNGFDPATGSAQVNVPPTSGDYTADPTAVEVVLSQPTQLLFSALFLEGAFDIEARAVARAGFDGEYCIMGLDPTATKTVALSGNAVVELDCGLISNSSSGEALYLGGGSQLIASPIGVNGDYSVGTNATTSTPPATGLPPVPDPYADLSVPPYTGCDHNNTKASSGSLSAGVYCGGIDIQGDVHLDPGVYIIDGGGLRVNAGASLTGDDVTIILTKSNYSSGNKYGTVDINGGATVTLSAPTSGTWSGIAFYQDRNAPDATNNFNGGANLNIEGALYFPSQEVIFNGGAEVGGAECTQIVSRQVTFGGNAVVGSNCDFAGTRSFGYLKPRLVE